MRRELLRWLVCPACHGTLFSDPEPGPGEDVVSGRLKCQACDAHFPIHNGIPRFLGAENYASSFGLQWNRFRREQLDSLNGFTLSRDRFVSETTFTPERLNGLTVLDVGCGAGRFLDIAGSLGAAVVGVDITTAVDAAPENLTDESQCPSGTGKRLRAALQGRLV